MSHLTAGQALAELRAAFRHMTPEALGREHAMLAADIRRTSAPDPYMLRQYEVLREVMDERGITPGGPGDAA